MEGSEEYKRRRNRSRSRRRRAHAMNSVSNRLNPEFDPRLYYKNDQNLPQKSFNSRDSDEELDPNTMDFATLVGCLHPTFIFDYLRRILQFLKSSDTELSFPDIAPYKETFLVKIANNNERLMCEALNEACRALGDQILRVIEENRNVYRWIHVYEIGRVSQNVLVYKKMFYNERKLANTNDEFKRPGIPPSQLASKLENLSLNKPENKRIIPITLKTNFLNSTIKFLKEDNQLNLEYPQMSVEQAEYFDSVICQYNTQTDLGFGYESLYAQLYKALKEVAYKFEFQVVRNIVGEDTVCMFFKKIPIGQTSDHKQSVRNYPQETPPHRISAPPAESFKEPPRHNEKYLSKQRLVNAISENFIRTSLERILEFVDDESRASLEFSKLTADESAFLLMVVHFCRTISNYTNLFSEEIVITFKKIFRVLKYYTQQRNQWRIDVAVSKQDRNRLVNVTFEKIPKMADKWKRSNSVQDSSQEAPRNVEMRVTRSTTDPNRSRDDSNDRSIPDISKRLLELSTRDVSSTSTSLDNSTEHLGLGFSKGNDSATRKKTHSKDRSKADRSLSRGRKKNSKESRNTSKYAISFQSAGEQILDTVSLCTTPNDSCQNDVKCHNDSRMSRQLGGGRKQRLMDDLLTPVDIDKAKRMMQQMGWDGGPLGARGEGITEPIMPAIHLAPGAGLGHTKPQSHSTSEFRLKFLKSLLTFVTGADTNIAICFEQPLTKRELRFLAPTIKCINKRKSIGLQAEETHVVNRIVEEMKCQTTLLLKCELHNLRKEIRVCKTEGDASKTKITPRKKTKETTSSNKNIPILSHIADQNTEIITTDDILSTHIDMVFENPKGYEKVATKVKFLKAINDFLQVPEEKKDYICDFVLNTKQRDYIHQVVTTINRRDLNFKFGTEMENRMFRDMKKRVNNCHMTCIFSGQKFTLHKRYYTKRFTNSNLPTPISKDVENTIIYENNTVRRLSDISIEDKHKNSDKIDIKTRKHDINKSVNDTSDNVDSNDYQTSSDQDDVLLIDNTEFVDLETDSEDDVHTTDVKSDDEYKDLESDCEEILDASDGSLMLDLLEKENDACVKFNIDSEDIIDIGNIKIEKNFDEKSFVKAKKSAEDLGKLDEVKTDLIVLDKFGETEKISDLNEPKKNDMSCSKDIKDSVSQENRESIRNPVDISIDDGISLTPPLMDYKSDIKTLTKHEAQEIKCVQQGSPKLATKNITTLENKPENIFSEEESHSNYSNSDDVTNSVHEELVKAHIMISEVNNNSGERAKKNLLTKENQANDDFSDIKMAVNNEIGANNCGDNLVLKRAISKDSILIESSPSSSKRSRSNSENSDKISKKYKYEIPKEVSIISKDTDAKIDVENAKVIQKNISDNINDSIILPLLDCLGIQNGVLLYKCYNEESVIWLKNVINKEENLDVQVQDYNKSDSKFYTLNMKLKSYIAEDNNLILRRIELFNTGINTSDWEVIDRKVSESSLVMTVKMDAVSYHNIRQNNFSLFAGVTRAQFCTIWD